MKIKSSALIFDMDGVLVNSEKIWAGLEMEFLKQFVPQIPTEYNSKVIGKSLKDIYNMLLKDFPKIFLIEKSEFITEYEKFGLEKIYPKTQLLPKMYEFLEKMSKKLPLALASSAQDSWVKTVVDTHQIRQFFKVIVCSKDVKEAKPNPEIFLLAAQKLNIKPEKCTVLEDSNNGVIAGKKAGMTVFGIRNGYNDEQNLSKADKIFNIKDLHTSLLKAL